MLFFDTAATATITTLTPHHPTPSVFVQACAEFAAALGAARRLQFISLRRNKIGASESRNIVQPSFVTGPEALAEALSDARCALEMLDLGW